MFLILWTALPACLLSAAPDPWSSFRSGGMALCCCLLPQVLLPWTPSCHQSTTHHIAHHCCHHSRCHHHNATDSGYSSRSDRETRPPRTPGVLQAQMSQSAVHGEHTASKPFNKAFWGQSIVPVLAPALLRRCPPTVGLAHQETQEMREKAQNKS